MLFFKEGLQSFLSLHLKRPLTFNLSQLVLLFFLLTLCSV